MEINRSSDTTSIVCLTTPAIAKCVEKREESSTYLAHLERSCGPKYVDAEVTASASATVVWLGRRGGLAGRGGARPG